MRQVCLRQLLCNNDAETAMHARIQYKYPRNADTAIALQSRELSLCPFSWNADFSADNDIQSYMYHIHRYMNNFDDIGRYNRYI